MLTLLQPLVQRWKAFVPAQVLLARAEDDLGDSVSATRRIEGLPPSSWRIPEAGRERVRSARRLDRTDEALERLRGVLQARPGDGSSLSLLAETLADRGDVAGAADALRSALRLSPTSNDVRLRLAELLASNGKLEDGLTLFSEARGALPRRSGDLRAEGPDPPLRGTEGAGARRAGPLAGPPPPEPGAA